MPEWGALDSLPTPILGLLHGLKNAMHILKPPAHYPFQLCSALWAQPALNSTEVTHSYGYLHCLTQGWPTSQLWFLSNPVLVLKKKKKISSQQPSSNSRASGQQSSLGTRERKSFDLLPDFWNTCGSGIKMYLHLTALGALGAWGGGDKNQESNIQLNQKQLKEPGTVFDSPHNTWLLCWVWLG